MKNKLIVAFLLMSIFFIDAFAYADGETFVLRNDAYELTATLSGKDVIIGLKDLKSKSDLANMPYIYRASRLCEEGIVTAKWLKDASVKIESEKLIITGTLAGLKVMHFFNLPKEGEYLEEYINVTNSTREVISLEKFEFGLQRTISDETGRINSDLNKDRLIAIPFRRRSSDPPGFNIDFSMADLIKSPGREHRVNRFMLQQLKKGYMPSMQWSSEGWAWTHGSHTLGIFKFNQEEMEFSIISPEVYDDKMALRFGGSGTVDGSPSLENIKPGETLKLGITRFRTLEGDYRSAYYAFRKFLDENGCRFPDKYNPSVHWNELYDNAEWYLQSPGTPAEPRSNTRAVTYTRELIMKEAEKANRYSCEALYLDPGWDTDFGTFIWGKEWLGPMDSFVKEIKQKYDLKLALHCPMATWMSLHHKNKPLSTWPSEAYQMDEKGKIITGAVCQGSKQYVDEAEKRLLQLCADGASFLMFDGTWWNGGCWNPVHGHPVPYTKENHIQAQIELVQRVHNKFPNVIIELHDPIHNWDRYMPVYYKYGIPGSYDENWGFELMWDPLEAIKTKGATSLYYYNLGCNVPVYLHIDLRDDNEHCLELWWYASTCRHLGIGGTHNDPLIAQSQQLAMKKYRKLEEFYKRGEFYGISEEIHLHVLPDDNSFVVNLFNLSDEPRTINGEISLKEIQLDPDKWYISSKGGTLRSGKFSVSRTMQPWAAEVLEVYPINNIPASKSKQNNKK